MSAIRPLAPAETGAVYQALSSRPGRLIVSFDFEIGWGSIENGMWRSRERAGVYSGLRKSLKTFIATLNSLEIAASWATVGAMISEPGPDDFAHLPNDARTKTCEFFADAGAETRDGRDLFDLVAMANTPQDIGSHTYSHLRFSYPGFDADARLADMTKARAALARADIHNPQSFVYPLNHAQSRTELAQTGFSMVRTAPLSPPRTRLGKLWSAAMDRPPAAAIANAPDGTTLLSGSLFFNWGTGRSAPLRRALITRQTDRGLRHAARTGTALHLWLHPFNLAETPGLLDGLTATLTNAARLRDRGELQIATMADLAA